MIGIDTNILVRYVVQDDPAQAGSAGKFLDSLSEFRLGYIPLATVVELVWVLNRSYKLNRADVTQALALLLSSTELRFENHEAVRRALQMFQVGRPDFGDCLIASCSLAAGCDGIVTLDKGAAKFAGMRLLQ